MVLHQICDSERLHSVFSVFVEEGPLGAQGENTVS